MRVWVLTDHYDEVSVYSEDTNVMSIPYVRIELANLEGGYEDEREDFISDIAYAQRRGRGRAEIEERFTIELMNVDSI